MTDIIKLDPDTIDRAIAATLLTVAQSSKRVYQCTYNKWLDWCYDNSIAPTAITGDNITAFLTELHVTKRTRARQMSALRSLSKVIALMVDTQAARVNAEIIARMKLPDANLSDNERNTKALNTEQVARLLAVWSEDTPIHIRNRALVAFILATGVRRSEAVAFEWRDIDLINGTALVRHGKGDKSRHIAIVGEYALTALKRWYAACGGEMRYIFVGMDNQGNIQADKPITADNLYRIMKQAQALSGVEFTPHDIRRTLATDLLANGASLADVQEQLGHASESTTLRYAKSVDAATRRERFKTSYGD
jgi:integrase